MSLHFVSYAHREIDGWPSIAILAEDWWPNLSCLCPADARCTNTGVKLVDLPINVGLTLIH